MTKRQVKSIESLVMNNAVSRALSIAVKPPEFASGPEVADQLSEMFTRNDTPQRAQLPAPSNETLSELEGHIFEELFHLPAMRGAGPTGTFYEHIRPANGQEDDARTLAKVLAMLPAASAPAEAIRVHRSAKLSAQHKPATPPRSRGVRPLGSGSSFWRVAMRGWVRMFRDEAREACGTTQYGIGTKGACTALRVDLQLEWMCEPDNALLGIDLRNMHGRVRTAHLEHQVAHRVPRMLELMGWVRIPRSHVYPDGQGGLHRIDASDGLDQGCPASNILAPISIADCHEELADYGSVYGLQDDTYLLADKARIPVVCDQLPAIFAPAGQEIVMHKCWVATPTPCSTGASGIPCTQSPPEVLRLPLPIPDATGAIVYTDAPIEERIQTRRVLLDRLAHLRQGGLSSQTVFLMLRLGTAGDANYTAQSFPMSSGQQRQFDNEVLNGVSEVLNIDPAEMAPDTARWFLQWREGGMGLFAMQHAADPLFMSNWLAGLDRVAARRGYTSARALLDTLPGLESILNQIAASMAAKGVNAASNDNQLIEKGDFVP